ncbi:sirohydrochlorin ferrochelatase [Actinokineospora baliensis]|uniref:sirohydrochlorin chelatase n=1 Tax=Actinokineospora baliensis TaxID=547056 RepID=UPI0027DC1847|nr:sirohydrochlorin chelatase [Actinokineospora baliensis]MBM7772538.1 sirohydrochlorin ferrochelatase [Actinokineospora baliensis]
MQSIPLVGVAHGSRDPRSAVAVGELLDSVRALRPELDVRGAFLDLSTPPLFDVLSGLYAEGHRSVVVVPLLLGRAYHARVDLPGLLEEARGQMPHLSTTVSDVLGPDPRLETALLGRLAEVGALPGDPELGVVLAATGSSHAPANARVVEIAERWAHTQGWSGVRAAFASTATPDVAAAAAALRARGARRIAVASYFLAPGLLPDRVRAMAGDAVVAEPLGASVADVVLERYDEVTTSVQRTA